MKTGRWGRPGSLNLLITGNFPVITETQLEVTAAAKRPHSTREEAESKGTNKHMRPECHWSELINSFVPPKAGWVCPLSNSHTHEEPQNYVGSPAVYTSQGSSQNLLEHFFSV